MEHVGPCVCAKAGQCLSSKTKSSVCHDVASSENQTDKKRKRKKKKKEGRDGLQKQEARKGTKWSGRLAMKIDQTDCRKDETGRSPASCRSHCHGYAQKLGGVMHARRCCWHRDQPPQGSVAAASLLLCSIAPGFGHV